MKHEHCGFPNCKFSRSHNHIHCIRPHCEYVLHSSGQLFSHKRKHERKDNELAYRKYKLAQSMMQTIGGPVPASNLPFPFGGPAGGGNSLAAGSSPGLDAASANAAAAADRPPSSNGSMTSESSTPPLTAPPAPSVLQPNGHMKFPSQSLSSNPPTVSLSMSQPLPPSSTYSPDSRLVMLIVQDGLKFFYTANSYFLY